MKPFIVEDYDISQPVSESAAHKLLSNTSARELFLLMYKYFAEDGNRNLYAQWLNKNLSFKKRVSAEHIYTLALKSDIYYPELIEAAEKVLTGHYTDVTKLACLDYILYMKIHINDRLFKHFIDISKSTSKSIIVHLQANINLCVLDQYFDLAIEEIRKILYGSEHVRLLYRVANQGDYFKESKKKRLRDLVKSTIKHNQVDKSIAAEILSRFD